jgi:hypothetical protein
MTLAVDLRTASVAAEWLTSRTFTFRVEDREKPLSNTFVFHPNGFVVGYHHANESYWELEAGGINILSHNGIITCRMELAFLDGGQPYLTGIFNSPLPGHEVAGNRHFLFENDSDYHAGIQSFDVFDTLVARRCFNPLAVFSKVEGKIGIAGFATRRHHVEMSIFGRRPYGLDDIYDMLVAEGSLTERQAKVAKLVELDEEWETLLPIRQVIAFVNADDIIISDMYLPRSFIEKVLREKCGLQNKLYLSNYGKHHRTIWPGIKEEYKLRAHFGDNPHADISSPAAFGIPGNLVTISKWDKTEEILHSAGLAPYAHAIRELRLQTFHRDVAVRNALFGQISLNIPLMILGAFWLRHLAADYGADKIMTASRDCNLFYELLSCDHFVRQGMPPASYVRISRTLCYSATEEYEAYLRSHFGRKTLLVDFVGTGRSLNHIVDHLDLRNQVKPCILVAEDPENVPGIPKMDALVYKDFFAYRIFIEALNASLEGSAVGTSVQDHLVTIEAQPNEYDDNMRKTIAEMRAVFFRFLPILNAVEPLQAGPSVELVQAAAGAIMGLVPRNALRLLALAEAQGRNLRRGVAVVGAPAASA